MSSVPESFHDMFKRDLVAHFSTIMPDGTPFVRPVWIDYDVETDHVLINVVQGTQKEENARRNPKVGVSIHDTDSFYRFVSVQGEVDEFATDGVKEHIDKLAQRYLGREEWECPKDDVERVQIRIRPTDTVTAEKG